MSLQTVSGLGLLLLSVAATPFLPGQTSISFNFTNGTSVNGDAVLGSDLKTALDGATAATQIDLGSLLPGLILTVTPSQSDISNTNNGLGLDTGGTLSAAGDELTFSFNEAISLDFLDMGDFTGSGLPGEDSVSLSYSNSNPSVTLVGGDFDNNSSDTIAFATGNSLPADESFTLGRVDGDFAIEGFDVTVVPEPQTFALIAGLAGLAHIMTNRRRAGRDWRDR